MAANPAAIALGDGVGMREVGHYVLPDSDTWSFKTNKINEDGSFFGYGNDLVRGFDVYRFNGKPIGDVPALKPRDLRKASTGSSLSGNLAGSLAIVGPAMLLAALVRRRAVRKD